MSNALSIASVTAVLKDLLDNALVDHSVNTTMGSQVEVTAIAPDLIPTDNSATPRLNLYLYQVTPNSGWRNVDLPSRSAAGARLSNPPLALDLHYLLMAYASEDLQAEILLGYAMQLLHEMPVLTRDAIRATLAATSPVDGAILPPAYASLAASDLAEQVELVKITPRESGSEDIYRLWSAFQTPHRPSAAYIASVVLIEAHESVHSALPVLTRGTSDTGATVAPDLVPPYPTLGAVTPPNAQPSAYLGDTIALTGHHLDGTNPLVLFEHPRIDDAFAIPPAAATDAALEVAIASDPPTDPENWPAGIYALRLSVEQGGTTRTSNVLPLALSPRIDTIAALTNGATTIFTVQTTPEVRPAQRAALLVGEREIAADDHPAQTDTLSFQAEEVATGTYRVRLRVDGVESILVDRSSTPPGFVPSQQVTVS